MSDKETLAVYAAQVEKYAKVAIPSESDKTLAVFLEDMAPGAKILDWGCGVGNASAFMRDLGFAVTATDATPEFAAKARDKYGLPVRVETFADLDEKAAFDGVWASFSLLHDRKANMPARLAQIHRALVAGGRLALGLKLGEGEKRDEIGRFYAFYTEDELQDLLAAAGFTVTRKKYGEAKGLDGQMWPWIMVYAHA